MLTTVVITSLMVPIPVFYVYLNSKPPPAQQQPSGNPTPQPAMNRLPPTQIPHNKLPPLPTSGGANIHQSNPSRGGPPPSAGNRAPGSRMTGSMSNPGLQMQQMPNPTPAMQSAPASAAGSRASSLAGSAPHTPNNTPKSTTPTSTSGKQPGNFSSQSTPTKTGGPMGNATTVPPSGVPPPIGGTKVTPTEEEDTFKNLKKTFANIFGDM